jgi:hypothetical protein
MFFFVNVTIVTSACSVSLTPVAQPLSIAFNVQPIAVTMTSIIFHITYIPMTFVSIKLFKDVRPSIVFRIACVNLILGGWLRILAQRKDNFTLILVGFAIMSLSYPVFLSAVTLLCNKWMGDKERTFMIQICGLTIPIGTVVSFALSGLIFSDSSNLLSETYTLIWIQNIWITLFAGSFAVLVKDQPETPPSAVAT